MATPLNRGNSNMISRPPILTTHLHYFHLDFENPFSKGTALSPVVQTPNIAILLLGRRTSISILIFQTYTFSPFDFSSLSPTCLQSQNLSSFLHDIDSAPPIRICHETPSAMNDGGAVAALSCCNFSTIVCALEVGGSDGLVAARGVKLLFCVVVEVV